jgi:hypothetical protein
MDSNDNQTDVQTDKVPLSLVKTVINEILLPIPWLWLLVASIATIISLFKVTRSPEGLYTVSFQLTWVTVLLLALVWLPYLLKVLALSGGGLTVMGGEASFQGLGDFLSQLSPEAEREVLPSVIAAIRLTEETSTGADRKNLQRLREDLEERLGAILEKGALYEKLRSDMPSGQARTFEFEKLMGEARALAKDTDIRAEEARGLFERGSHGDRFTVIALAQEKQNPELFPLVIEAIANSESAFEQFQALKAAYWMLPKLDEAQKQELVEVINDQRSGGEKKYILPGTDRWPLSNRILDALDSK